MGRGDRKTTWPSACGARVGTGRHQRTTHKHTTTVSDIFAPVGPGLPLVRGHVSTVLRARGP